MAQAVKPRKRVSLPQGPETPPPGLLSNVDPLLIWVGLGLLLALSVSLVVIAIPAEGPKHTASFMDFLSHYKAGAISLCFTAVMSAVMMADVVRTVIDSDPYILLNLIPIIIGLYGMWLSVVAVSYAPAAEALSDNLNFNKGLLLVSVMISYFVGGTVHLKQEIEKKVRSPRNNHRQP